MKKLSKKGLDLSKSKGFTLIELMVVMAIIAVLAVLIIGAIQAARRTQTETANRSNAKTLQTGLEAFYARNKAYCLATANNTCTTGTFSTKAAQLFSDGFLSSTALSSSSSAGGGGDVTALPAPPATPTYTLTIDDYKGDATSETIIVP
ncbi:MAG: prepilin-type N-terminal cleavage/methylation domain-containing protein [Patescibacteria group bacterium]|nr:prepilin-type N-terminal cleavage/methylation domain-containing protein [Patescibacteria group bacterium]